MTRTFLGIGLLLSLLQTSPLLAAEQAAPGAIPAGEPRVDPLGFHYSAIPVTVGVARMFAIEDLNQHLRRAGYETLAQSLPSALPGRR